MKHKPDPALHIAAGDLVFVDVFSVDLHLAAGRLKQRVQMLDKGRFSGSGMTENENALSLRQGYTDITDRGLFKRRADAVGMCQILYGYDCHAVLRCRIAAAMASAQASV